jgi:hypothetical protein
MLVSRSTFTIHFNLHRAAAAPKSIQSFTYFTTVRFVEPRFSESAGCIMDFGNSLLGRI